MGRSPDWISCVSSYVHRTSGSGREGSRRHRRSRSPCIGSPCGRSVQAAFPQQPRQSPFMCAQGHRAKLGCTSVDDPICLSKIAVVLPRRSSSSGTRAVSPSRRRLASSGRSSARALSARRACPRGAHLLPMHAVQPEPAAKKAVTVVRPRRFAAIATRAVLRDGYPTSRTTGTRPTRPSRRVDSHALVLGRAARSPPRGVLVRRDDLFLVRRRAPTGKGWRRRDNARFASIACTRFGEVVRFARKQWACE
jgi:hypothetical protein